MEIPTRILNRKNQYYKDANSPHISLHFNAILTLQFTEKKIIKKELLEENTDSNLSDISQSNTFLDMSPQARGTKAKINY